MGGAQSEIEACEAGRREAYHESRGPKENCGCTAQEMGAGEGEESGLNEKAATEGIRATCDSAGSSLRVAPPLL